MEGVNVNKGLRLIKAAQSKARSPLSFCFVFGRFSSSWSADLSDRVGVYGCKSSETQIKEADRQRIGEM